MDARQLGRVVRDRRGTLNLTQPELAGRAGVSLAYLYMLEGGGLPDPELAPLRRVACTLGLARLVALLDDVATLDGAAFLPPSVEALATAGAVDQFLREQRVRSGDGSRNSGP